ncbi:PREDICTED: uncharacterized protein LOC104818613 isoform X2 [Tarenaya hassleriana]|uniref:uncharacterized protein LOC104818613 isoform X2 n=1 Tax=Tarenaya hassleriana TaxID=28532 RepID=UPI00053C70DE|nr:PREDICTED: uncharacterized protein LOC104818613 isoform X2 [Tarenaya hassleriana]
MMQRRSPPKHRHDGSSPLPLGMDWSLPPRKWNGRDTVWPHDPRTGWNYCVTIPSWVVLPKSRNSDPIVFYRVQVGVQSPEGVTTTRGVLRRFNDFLKLLANLKREFPRKSFPSAPPKGLMRMKSRAMLEERRCSLEEWMTKLLSDIDLSRSVIVASFLELEAAARSACQDVDENASDANNDTNSTSSSPLVHPNLSLFQAGGTSSLTSDYGSDTAYDTSEFGSPSMGRDDISEIGTEDLTLDEDLTKPIEKLARFSMSNIDEGLSMGQTILEQLQDFPKHKVFTEPESSHTVLHDRKLSAESDDMPITCMPSSSSNSHLDLHEVSGVSVSSGIVGNSVLQGDAQIVLPMELLNKLNRIMLTMNQRLANAKTDMEELIARLNQEIAVKDYLNKKVNDLEVELETTKQRNKENLEQAIMLERERFTKMQWDMEELRQKSLEMEVKFKSREGGSSNAEPTGNSTSSERYELLQDLDITKQQLEDLSRRYEELEAKSKSDIKVLVKEVKSLRRSHLKLEKDLNHSLTEKSEAEKLLQEERKSLENALAARKRLLNDCRILHDRLKEYNINLSMDDEQGNFTEDSTTVADALRLLSTSDDQIEEAQLLAGFDETTVQNVGNPLSIGDETRIADDDLRKVLADIFIENAKLRKQVNSIMLRALRTDPKTNSANEEEKPETSAETSNR